MDCKSAQAQLHDYLSGETGPQETARIEDHLGGCPLCQQLFDRWKQFIRAVRRAGQDERAPAEMRVRIQQKLRATPARPVRPWLSFRFLAPAMAFLVVLAGAPVFLGHLHAIPFVTKAHAMALLPLDHVDGLTAALVNDHQRPPNTAHPHDAATIQQLATMEREHGLIATRAGIPQRLGDRLQRQGCGLCSVATAQVPHVRYSDGTHCVSLFMIPADKVKIVLQPGRYYQARCSHSTLLAWKRSDGVVCMLVSADPPEALARLAAAF